MLHLRVWIKISGQLNAGKSIVFFNACIIISGLITIGEIDINNFFAPEFRNRLDGMIKFNKLDQVIMRKIVIKFIDEINELIIEKGLHITIGESAVEELAKRGYDPLMGARPLKRVIENDIKIPLSKAIIKDKPIAGTKIILNFITDKDDEWLGIIYRFISWHCCWNKKLC